MTVACSILPKYSKRIGSIQFFAVEMNFLGAPCKAKHHQLFNQAFQPLTVSQQPRRQKAKLLAPGIFRRENIFAWLLIIIAALF